MLLSFRKTIDTPGVNEYLVPFVVIYVARHTEADKLHLS